jgi:hypothetical protein
VADIISLDEKLKSCKDKKDAQERKKKIKAVQKVFQCTQCAFKCERCGAQIVPNPGKNTKCEHQFVRVPYKFCESCEEEYLEYINQLKGKGDKNFYWHNEEWMKVWKDWIEYQSSVDRYLKSREFKQLLRELRQSGPVAPDN